MSNPCSALEPKLWTNRNAEERIRAESLLDKHRNTAVVMTEEAT